MDDLRDPENRRRENPAITEIKRREKLRADLAAVLGVNPEGAIGFRITERVISAAEDRETAFYNEM